MAGSSTDNLDRENSDREERLDQILATYLRALDAGETPDHARIIADHPDLRSDLNEFFSGQARLHDWAAPMRQAAEAAQNTLTQKTWHASARNGQRGCGFAKQTIRRVRSPRRVVARRDGNRL